MRTKIVNLLIAIVFAITTPGILRADDAPGWSKAGSKPADYDMGVDPTAAHTGSSSGFIRSKKPTVEGFGTLMQSFDATEYRGKRLRYSAFVKGENIAEWAGLWMRVDNKEKAVAFDNMQDRPIKDATPWTRYSIVLDVPQGADSINFGILLQGSGAAWIDDIEFAVVDESVPVTDITRRSEPRNLNFDE